VLDGDPAPSTERGTAVPPTFRPTSIVAKRSPISAAVELIMVALCNRADHYIFILFLLLSFFSSPNLSGRRLDVYHTLAHGVALVQI